MSRCSGDGPAFSRAEGFGIVEIVVSMFLLWIVAIAFLPLMIQALQLSVTNATIATATQLVDRELGEFRKQTPTCKALNDFATTPVDAVGDTPSQLQPRRSVDSSCPSAFPGVITVTSWVTRSGESDRVAEAATRILVTGP